MILKSGSRVTGNKRYPAGVMNSYPVPSVNGASYPRPEGYPTSGPAKSLEPYAIRCAQCRVPIEDHTQLATCWNCGSDNFLGQIF
jgi:hypothetical protein